jgi:hypothetical protein
MTAITGSQYFPGGMGTFEAPMNQYLVFEEGPSMNVQLQWATYQDASDQCSLSRIWGGIHPPMDDIAGRKIGMEVAIDAVNKADGLWTDTLPRIVVLECPPFVNDYVCQDTLDIIAHFDQPMTTNWGPSLDFVNGDLSSDLTYVDVNWMNDSTYRWRFVVQDNNHVIDNIDVKIMGASNSLGVVQRIFYGNNIFLIDTENPFVTDFSSNSVLINEAVVQTNPFAMQCNFSEPVQGSVANINSDCMTLNNAITTIAGNGTLNIILNFELMDENEETQSPSFSLQGFRDVAGNDMLVLDTVLTDLVIDTHSPQLISWTINTASFNESNAGGTWLVQAHFDEPMSNLFLPTLYVPVPMDVTLLNQQWLDSVIFEWSYLINDNNLNQADLVLSATDALDQNGNVMDTSVYGDYLQWEMNPWIEVLGCTDSTACNFDALANSENGTCLVPFSPCDDGDTLTINDQIQLDCSCAGEVVQSILDIKDDFSFYPNPGIDQLHLMGHGVVRIFDGNGRILFQQYINGRADIPVQSWAQGCYNIQTPSGNHTWLKAAGTEK